MEIAFNNKRYRFVPSDNKTDDVCHMCACKSNAEMCKCLCFGKDCAGSWQEVQPKKRIYISGPITGMPNNNKQAFDEAEKLLLSLGFYVINPLKNDLPSIATWKQHMIRDIENLFTCDCIFLLKDWNHSKGACIECSIAETLGMQIFAHHNITNTCE